MKDRLDECMEKLAYENDRIPETMKDVGDLFDYVFDVLREMQKRLDEVRK